MPSAYITELHGAEAREALDKVIGDASVVELGRELGIDPNEAVRNSTVEQLPEQLPESVRGVAGKLYVAVTWVDDSQRAVRTGHFISPEGAVDSNVIRVPKTGAEPVRFGALGRSLITVTEYKIQIARGQLTISSDYIDCVAECLGISSALLTVILAGCGLACAITEGIGCIICAAGALGFGVGFVTGCFFGCA